MHWKEPYSRITHRNRMWGEGSQPGESRDSKLDPHSVYFVRTCRFEFVFKHRRVVLGMAIVFALAFLGLWGAFSNLRRGSQPSYQGKDISSWLDDVASSTPSVRAQAENAFRGMGTSIVPALVGIMQTKEDSRLILLVKGLVEGLGLRKATPLEAERHWRAAKALRAIGPSAATAIPSLTDLLDNPQSHDKAVFALAGLGPRATESLTRALTNQYAAVRVTAAGVMRSLGPEAKRAVPALVNCLRDRTAPVRQQSAKSLGQLAEEPALVVAALTATLSDSDPGVRMSAALALGSFKGKAENAVAPLLRAKQDSDTEVRQAAMNALSQIRPAGPSY